MSTQLHIHCDLNKIESTWTAFIPTGYPALISTC